MHDQVVSFLQDPSAATYAELRSAATSGYRPESTGEGELWQMLEENRLGGVQEHIRRVMPDNILSPSFHLGIARFAEREGDQQRAEMERFFAFNLREQLLATGDGSLQRPYVVANVGDQYTILAALEKKVKDVGMALVEGRWLDVVRTRDGLEFCFDVSLPLKAYGR